MKASLFAYIRSLVLPFNATTGKRIEIDGNLGEIRFYDDFNNLILRLQPDTPLFAAFSINPATFLSARLLSDTNPRIAISTQGIITWGSGSGIADTQLSRGGSGILRTDTLDAGDFTLNGVSMPRGLVVPPALFTANDAARLAGVNTDRTIAFTADVTRRYVIHFKSQFNVSAGGVVYALNLSEGGTTGNNNGNVIDRIGRWSAAELAVGSTTGFVTAEIPYEPAAGPVTLHARNDAASGGTITMIGAAAIQSALWVEDVGPR